MLSKLTLLGLHKYSDGSIWDDLQFPEGINKEIAVNEILRQCSEFSLLYPDMEYLKSAIAAWGRKWYFTFNKWITVINTEYEPLWNLDVHIDITDDGNKSGDKSGTTQGSTQGTVTGSTQGSTTENTTGSTSASTDLDATNTHQNAAYDSDEFKNAEKDVRDESTSSTGSSSQTVTGSSTGSSSETSTGTSSGSSSEEWTEADTNDHTEYRRGNQGITKSQDMLMDELNVRTWNIYSHIADIFANEFCITLYI